MLLAKNIVALPNNVKAASRIHIFKATAGSGFGIPSIKNATPRVPIEAAREPGRSPVVAEATASAVPPMIMSCVSATFWPGNITFVLVGNVFVVDSPFIGVMVTDCVVLVLMLLSGLVSDVVVLNAVTVVPVESVILPSVVLICYVYPW